MFKVNRKGNRRRVRRTTQPNRLRVAQIDGAVLAKGELLVHKDGKVVLIDGEVEQVNPLDARGIVPNVVAAHVVEERNVRVDANAGRLTTLPGPEHDSPELVGTTTVAL